METIYIPTHIHTTFFENSAIILDVQKNSYHALNNTAADFWKFLMQYSSFESALNELSQLYNHSSDAIREDMEELVDSLLAVGLLQSL